MKNTILVLLPRFDHELCLGQRGRLTPDSRCTKYPPINSHFLLGGGAGVGGTDFFVSVGFRLGFFPAVTFLLPELPDFFIAIIAPDRYLPFGGGAGVGGTAVILIGAVACVCGTGPRILMRRSPLLPAVMLLPSIRSLVIGVIPSTICLFEKVLALVV